LIQLNDLVRYHSVIPVGLTPTVRTPRRDWESAFSTLPTNQRGRQGKGSGRPVTILIAIGPACTSICRSRTLTDTGVSMDSENGYTVVT